MYIPNHFKASDPQASFQFIQQFPFGILVSVDKGKPVATHLPFIAEKENGKIMLYTHMAKANEQWKQFKDQEVLIIFQRPHAYISPAHYEKLENVPTWNYVAVHAYGSAEIMNEKENHKLLEKMIYHLEPEYMAQWTQLPENYINKLNKGLISIKIEVQQLQGKEKLSQNKSAAERQKIINHLMDQTDPDAAILGELMKEKVAKRH